MLEVALDTGIKELEFWGMTLAEVYRHIESYKRVKERENKDKATYDYILADLIGRSVSRIYNSSNKMPPIADVYTNIFDKEELEKIKYQKQQELYALRFKQFALAHNTKLGGGKD